MWEKDPSVQAFADLLNRALDKPKEQEQEVKLQVEGDWDKLAARLSSARQCWCGVSVPRSSSSSRGTTGRQFDVYGSKSISGLACSAPPGAF